MTSDKETDETWRPCDQRLHPMQHALSSMCLICAECKGKMIITAGDNGLGGFSVKVQPCNVCAKVETDEFVAVNQKTTEKLDSWNEYDLPSDTKGDSCYDPDYQREGDLDDSTVSGDSAVVPPYRPTVYKYYYEGVPPKIVEFSRESAFAPWIKIQRGPVPREAAKKSPSVPIVTPAKKSPPPPAAKKKPPPPAAKKSPPPPAAKKKPPPPAAKKSPPPPAAKKSPPPPAAKKKPLTNPYAKTRPPSPPENTVPTAFIPHEVQPDPSSSDDEDGRWCPFCNNDPCLWFQLKSDVVSFDLRRNDNVGGDQAVGWNERNASRRWRSYSYATYIIRGFLGKGNRERLPKCVVRGIRALFPSKDGKYTDYKPARGKKR